MPVVYRCSRCGHILYVYDRVSHDLVFATPLEVAAQFSFKCPRCGAQLNPRVTLERVRVKVRVGQ